MPRPSHYNKKWDFDWLEPVENDLTCAYCRICTTDFSIKNKGNRDVKEHSERPNTHKSCTAI